ncbi:metal ABC transporter permease [Oscillospiraceae bacterium OttesenSCG-928-F05]|nr:metal ABC transporter permease [Oscillospiraceae bacterium OttesenSCG-928-F05]
MVDILREMLTYPFLTRALIVGTLVALCAALLGTSLVLKRYAMIGDGLSHVGFGALALATVLNLQPLAVTIPVVVAAAFLLLRLSENSKVKGDSAIAMIATGSLAVGVMLVSLSGTNTDLNAFLFGSILSMRREDVVLSAILSAAVLVLYVLFYNKLFAVTFDETFARAAGIGAGRYTMLLALLTAVTVVLGMRMMGSLLISALILFPALSAMRVCRTFRSVTVCAAVVSVVSFVAGLVLSYRLETPTGASVVVVGIGIFLIFCLAGALRGRSGAGARP